MLITGGATGITRQRQPFREEGARVFTAQHGPDPTFEHIAADLADPHAAVSLLIMHFNNQIQIDVMVGNAGIMEGARMKMT